MVACVFEEIEPELTRISLRSKSEKVNVNEIAAQFGGGGHPAAAGARIPGKPWRAAQGHRRHQKRAQRRIKTVHLHAGIPALDGAIAHR